MDPTYCAQCGVQLKSPQEASTHMMQAFESGIHMQNKQAAAKDITQEPV